MSNILITGASGQLGQLVIDHLVKRTDVSNIIAMVRTDEQEAAYAAKGIATRRGDYNDQASLESAFAGVERLLLISSSEIGMRITQHKAAIEAAKAAGVSYIAYTSILNAADSDLMLAAEHKETENMIAQSGLAYTFLRNGWYTENNQMSLEQDLKTGQHFGASVEGKFSFAARNDYAEAAAIVMLGGYDGQTLELAGDIGITMGEYVDILSEVSGKKVTYIDIPAKGLKQGMMDSGIPEVFAELLSSTDESAAKGALFNNSKTLSKIIGRPTTQVKDTLSAWLAK